MSRTFANIVKLSQGDITKIKIDAIVNAAENALLGGGGVDGAIHRAAGPKLLAECRTLNGCKDGDAKITKGYNLPAKYVIHTVGPQNSDPKVLESCYARCLQVLVDNKLHSIAFPCVATGVYGFDKEKAAHIALKTVHDKLEEGLDIDKVLFVLFNEKDKAIYKDLLPKYFPGASTEFET